MDCVSSFYDVAVIGSGIIESLVAAASARSGLRVLHIEETPFFGDSNTTCSLDEIESWIKYQKDHSDTSPFHSFSLTKNLTHPLATLLKRQSRHFSIDITPHLIPCKGEFLSLFPGSLLKSYMEFVRIECSSLLSSSRLSNTLSHLIPVPQSIQEILSSPLTTSEQYKFVPLLRDIIKWDGVSDSSPLFQGCAHKPFTEFLKRLSMDSSDLTSFIAYCICGYSSRLFPHLYTSLP